MGLTNASQNFKLCECSRYLTFDLANRDKLYEILRLYFAYSFVSYFYLHKFDPSILPVLDSFDSSISFERCLFLRCFVMFSSKGITSLATKYVKFCRKTTDPELSTFLWRK